MATPSHHDRLASELAEQAVRRWGKTNPNYPLTSGERGRLLEIIETYLRIVSHRAYTRGYRRGRARHA